MKNIKKLTLLHAKEIAKSKKGVCLSREYTNIDTKLKWECEFKHKWEASLYNIKNKGSWCPACAGVRKLTMEQMQELAKVKGGKCLSTEYVNSDVPLTWECQFGHRWDARPNSIKNKNSWCPDCAGVRKRTIEQMQELAKQKGGKCLSREYKTKAIKLKWQCSEGHRWSACPDSIINGGTWCPTCSGNMKLTIELMRDFAKKRNGKCLSTKYHNSNSKLTWECHLGHQWDARFADVKEGRWCLVCFPSKRKGENAVRTFFEQIFNKKFPSSRPYWLKYDGRLLELDGFCQELQIAFEYQGRYHFDENANWYPDPSMSFERRQLLDNFKRNACEKNNIILIEISELNPRRKPESWKSDIKDLLLSKGIKIPSNYDDVRFGSIEYHAATSYIHDAFNMAKSRDSFCLSKNITFKDQAVKWKCSLGHVWHASLSQVQHRNTWCPDCSGVKKLTLAQMQGLAKSRGGRCLSTKYINANTKLKWQCSKNHIWLATPSSIRNQNSWCGECQGRNKKLSIEQMQELAKTRGGKCLSVEYINGKSKLKWQCNKNHIWLATPSVIKNHGTWCPICGGSNKLTIDEMQKIAKAKGGDCLSKHYVNAKTKLHWQCSEGHQWFATPDKVKYAGRWCKKCKNS